MKSHNVVDLDSFYFKKQANGFPFPRNVRSIQNKVDLLYLTLSNCLEYGYQRRDLVVILEGLKEISLQYKQSKH